MEARIELDGHAFTVVLEQEDGRWTADVDGQRFAVHVAAGRPGTAVTVDGHMHLVGLADPTTVLIDGRGHAFRILTLAGVAGADALAAGGHGAIRAPMAGKLDAILVEEGQQVQAGDVLFVLEAMKMRNQVKAPAAGTIARVLAKAGDALTPDDVVVELQAS